MLFYMKTTESEIVNLISLCGSTLAMPDTNLPACSEVLKMHVNYLNPFT